MGILKAMLIVLSIMCLLAGCVSVNVYARAEARWALQVGDILTGEDISLEHPMAQLFHQQTLNTTDVEHFNMDFPLSADGLDLGSTTIGAGVGIGADTGAGVGTDGTGIGVAGDTGLGAGLGLTASANVLPFGPVNLAFPDIHQDVTQTVSETSTGFFHANWAYMADMASGNLGSAPLGIGFNALAPFKSGKMIGSGLVWPYMTPLQSQTARYNMINLGNLGASSVTPLDETISRGVSIG